MSVARLCVGTLKSYDSEDTLRLLLSTVKKHLKMYAIIELTLPWMKGT